MGVNMKKIFFALCVVMATCVGCSTSFESGISDAEYQRMRHDRLVHEEKQKATRAAIQQKEAFDRAIIRQGL
jgi:hypothetical protein